MEDLMFVQGKVRIVLGHLATVVPTYQNSLDALTQSDGARVYTIRLWV